MPRDRVSSGSPFEKKAGFSRAVIDGPWCFVSGTAGYDYQTMVMPDDVETQTHNIFKTLQETLQQHGFALKHVIKATYIVADRDYADPFLDVCGHYFGDIRPAVTLMIAELYRPEIKVDIDVTAYRP
ncbi:MAG: RidA family protein [Pseudomonadota bacterium]